MNIKFYAWATLWPARTLLLGSALGCMPAWGDVELAENAI